MTSKRWTSAARAVDDSSLVAVNSKVVDKVWVEMLGHPERSLLLLLPQIGQFLSFGDHGAFIQICRLQSSLAHSGLNHSNEVRCLTEGEIGK